MTLSHAATLDTKFSSEKARIRNGDESAVREARSRSDSAHAEVDRLNGEIDSERQLSERDRDAIRTQIRQEIRETIRSAVRG